MSDHFAVTTVDDVIEPAPVFSMESLSDWFTVKGDMMGDKILVEQPHLDNVELIRSGIDLTGPKTVVAIAGPSGSGKSETASVLASQFATLGRKSYVLSMDNYPKLPPKVNENHRAEVHQQDGEPGLRRYLGTTEEIDFDRVTEIVRRFKEGVDNVIPLRIMNNPGNVLHNDALEVDFAEIDLLVLEGTWSGKVEGTDVRVFIDKTREETHKHRVDRDRDEITDFGELVLEIEQVKLNRLRDLADYRIFQGRLIKRAGE